ncbi:MAG: putative membrane protein YgcG, partial [Pirellulaceae bacterium]
GGGVGGGGGGGVTVNQFSIHNDPKIPTDDIAELLQELVVPKSWESEDAYVRALPGRLVIRQTVENHRAIIDFLKDLAVYRGLSPHESAKSISNPGYSGGGIRGSFGGGGGAQGGFFTVPDGKSNQK